jgi:hypothetical protein
MKRSFLLCVAVVVVTVMAGTIAAGQSQNQSLGDYARAVKKTKNPSAAKSAPKVYDNDNLPANTSISVVGDTSEPAADQKKDEDQDQSKAKNPDGTAKDDKSGEKKPDPQLKPGQSAEDRQKALDAWKDKLAGEKDKISLLSRELDVLQREHQLKAAEFYADTARRTQNPNGFVAEDTKYKQQIADKQKQLDDAKAKLNDLQDEARKSGAPNAVTE